ncbi:hypothetical protein AMECASPLE_009190 [Ameca splendens]|uniref:Uncharacterized protein n=1 Tax=Ameca splendens TaxID=208324 RepID=A0ABV0XD95_9TELE
MRTCTLTYCRLISHTFRKWATGQYFSIRMTPNTSKMTSDLHKKLMAKELDWPRMSLDQTPISVITCEALEISMPKRAKAALENNGVHTKYGHNVDIVTCSHFCCQRFRQI